MFRVGIAAPGDPVSEFTVPFFELLLTFDVGVILVGNAVSDRPSAGEEKGKRKRVSVPFFLPLMFFKASTRFCSHAILQ